MSSDWKRTCERFADLLSYPGPDLPARARECAALLAPADPRAARTVRRFRSLAAAAGPPHMEEMYTATFDLQPACPPYVGCYLFGEDRSRGIFLVRLKERYRALGLPPEMGNELPDHLAVMLRFLARIGPGEEERDLLEFCLLPAVQKMAGRLRRGSGNPYRPLLRALLLALEGRRAAAGETRGAPGGARRTLEEGAPP